MKVFLLVLDGSKSHSIGKMIQKRGPGEKKIDDNLREILLGPEIPDGVETEL